MNFPTAVKTCLVKFVSVEGRASRSEFWWFQLFYLLVTFGVVVAGGVFVPHRMDVATNLAVLMSFIVLIPVLSVGARRFHDLDRSGWHLLWGLIPFAGVVLYGWWTLPGTKGPNRFGPDPLA